MIRLRSIKNNRGFTLVEVMMAILIMMIGMFGLLEIITVSTQHNMKNQLREEGVQLGQAYMTDLRGKTFDKYSAVYQPMAVRTKMRGTDKIFMVERSTLDLASDTSGVSSKQLMVTVKWAFHNQSSLNRVVSVMSRP